MVANIEKKSVKTVKTPENINEEISANKPPEINSSSVNTTKSETPTKLVQAANKYLSQTLPAKKKTIYKKKAVKNMLNDPLKIDTKDIKSSKVNEDNFVPIKNIKQELPDLSDSSVNSFQQNNSQFELKKPFKKRDFEKIDTKPKIMDPVVVKKEIDVGNESDDLPLSTVQSTVLENKLIDDPFEFKTEESDLEKSSNSTIHKRYRKTKLKTPLKANNVHKVKSSKVVMLKKRLLKGVKKKKIQHTSSDSDHQKSRRMKLYSFWNGPKRHRVASLNAIAKVHCLYENESRGAFLELLKPKRARTPEKQSSDSDPPSPPVQRTLRSAPGMRGVGKHWDMHTSSSSEESVSSAESSNENLSKIIEPPPSYKQKQLLKNKEKPKKVSKPAASATSASSTTAAKRRNRTEIVMDLKDMVVRKRMASLNATAILAASYSPEKRSKCGSSDETESSEESDDSDDDDSNVSKHKRRHYVEKDSDDNDRKVISNKKKVSVIVNQDTDVTITGVYVNSTTRSTHLHEGYCSIAGMQYRISATSHTQTNATAVSTETLQLHSGAPNSDQSTAGGSNGSDQQSSGAPPMQPCKSYTPLGALSSMQPPGVPPPASATVSVGGSGVVVQPPVPPPPPPLAPPAASLSPMSAAATGRVRHSCSSAFSAPPYGPPPPHTHHHLHPATKVEHPPPHGYIHGYYQPAGPLISTHHPHSHVAPQPGPVLGPISSASQSTSSGGGDTPHNPQPPTAAAFRYTSYSAPAGAPPPGYSYGFPPTQYYTSAQYGPSAHQPHFHHQDLCYTSSAPYPPYIHSKAYPAPSGPYHRRYISAPPPQYYPQEVYSSSQGAQQSTQVVTAVSTTGSAGPGGTFQPPPTGPPPPPTLVETYQPPPTGPVSIVEPYPGPPPHYFGYSTSVGPPPGCYSHSPPTRSLAFIDASYQSCPCPMQSCPKNVHTGPLTGDGKRSNMTVIAKESTGMPLPPVALALPLEPASVVGPPSPARGSAGMPPPPSPAGATYQPVSTPKQEDTNNNCPTPENKPTVTNKTRRKARVGKDMVRNTIASNFTYRQTENTMLLMCHSTDSTVKREALSPENEVIIIEKDSNENRLTPIVEDDVPFTKGCIKPQTAIVLPEKVENICTARVKPLEEDDCSKHSPDTTTIEEDTSQPKIDDAESKLEDRLPVPIESNDTLEDTNGVTSNSNSNSNCEQETTSTTTIKEETIDNNCRSKSPTGTKRKLNDDEENENDETIQVQKKQKSSYKDLINKNPGTIQIINGKKKLVCQVSPNRNLQKTKIIARKPRRTSSPKIMKVGVKRKKSQDDIAKKKCKTIKSLTTASMDKSNDIKNVSDENLILKEKNTIICAKSVAESKTAKKTAPALLDSLLLNNNNNNNNNSSSIDQTIDSVISSICAEETILPTSISDEKCIDEKKNTIVENDKISEDIVPEKLPTATTNKHTGRIVTRRKSKLTKAKSRNNTKKNVKVIKPVEVVPMPIMKVPRRSSLTPRWSNGWSWEGEPYQARVFLNSDDTVVTRTCYPAMRHIEGDVIYPRDCVLLKSGQRKIDLPFVAKVAALWENPEDGEMMMSLFWFYRPEHTEQGRLPTDHPDEVFASRHKDTNSVACIEDKCYVLTFFEYCRYYKSVRLLEDDSDDPEQIVPMPECGTYPRNNRQPPKNQTTSPDLVFFCSRVYDFRQKRVVKNPN
ncbi:uncharacterized protein LOC123293980 isoform X2 [Chrysoperla carnea]|uniref:uncharacterized protein LOC123293980 isoform X2 n=1 Tax=Chrysoperla carnea TaxID=189513 RepID=UPI001D0802C8|nr:uncharacterized protein LOC123293980 isoform X2 [Chrysoperla carnea]